MTRRTRRTFAVLATVLILTVACGSSASEDTARFGGRIFRRDSGASGTTPAGLPASTTTTTAKPTYDVSIKPYNCPFDRDSANRLTVDCFQFIVPEHRDDPKSPKIFLAVARIHSTNPTPKPDPIIYLEGGPGGSALASIDRWTKPVDPLLTDRDVILIDQRGTGYSQPRLNCDRAFLDSPHGAFDDRRPQSTKCLADLAAENIHPEYYNTVESAHDIADLRTELKLASWNLFGISYGTRLALVTMQIDPAGIRSVVIDSVYPPGYARLIEQEAPDLNRALEAIFADCAAQPSCAGAFPNLRGALYGAVDKLNASPYSYLRYDPVTGDDVEFKFTGAEFMLELFSALYITEIIPDVPAAINLAARGNVVDAVDLLEGRGAYERKRAKDKDNHYTPPPGRGRPDITDGLYSSVECAEDMIDATPDTVNAAAAGLAPQIADSMVRGGLRLLEVCSVWGVTPKPLAETHSDIPTLVLAGTYDPITPPDWGQRAASNITGSRFVVVTGAGHAVYYSGDCPKQLVKQFFQDPAAPGPDCPGAVPEFTTKA